MDREEARTRPLFEEVTPAIYREDAWSGPHGFLFDAMTLLNGREMSQQFLDAADHLVEGIRRLDHEDYRIGFPILFLCRHAIELVLKSVLPGAPKHHRLDALFADLYCQYRDARGYDVPEWITTRIAELAQFDPTSTAFRYPEVGEAGWKSAGLHVGVYHLRRAIHELHTVIPTIAEASRTQRPTI
ncbi:hypothetical protein IP70_17000 [alpha proteobacterium AAP38]|nr:hypothetical protein IP70_17000 [alpha proteobacterium AAP38]